MKNFIALIVMTTTLLQDVMAVQIFSGQE